jgi:hypothetical protein
MDAPDLIPHAIQSTKAIFNADAELVGEDVLLVWLEEKVANMLDHDFNGLVNLLYRIDVYESKAKTCFGKQNKDIARCLAQLIWERQLQKARTRFEL